MRWLLRKENKFLDWATFFRLLVTVLTGFHCSVVAKPIKTLELNYHPLLQFLQHVELGNYSSTLKILMNTVRCCVVWYVCYELSSVTTLPSLLSFSQKFCNRGRGQDWSPRYHHQGGKKISMGKHKTSADFISFELQHQIGHGLKIILCKGNSWYNSQVCKANS